MVQKGCWKCLEAGTGLSKEGPKCRCPLGQQGAELSGPELSSQRKEATLYLFYSFTGSGWSWSDATYELWKCWGQNRGRDHLTGREKLRVHFRMKEILTSPLVIIPRQLQGGCCEANTSTPEQLILPSCQRCQSYFLLSVQAKPTSLYRLRISEVWEFQKCGFTPKFISPVTTLQMSLSLLQGFFISSSSSLSSSPSLSSFSFPFSFSSFSPSSSLNSFIVV